MNLLEYVSTLGDVRSVDIARLDEPRIEPDRCEKIDYIKLEDLCVGDILSIKGDRKAHPNARYLVEIAEIDAKRVVRIWNIGRGPYCFVGSLNAVNYYARREKKGELGALKVGAISTWPYFVVHAEGLMPPEETWADGVGEILLQRNEKKR